MAGQQIFLAAVTVAELRYGALVAGWGDQRRDRLEQSIAATTVVPVSDALLTGAAELRHACRQAGHPLHEPVHANDSGSRLPQFTSTRRFSPPTPSSTTYPDSASTDRAPSGGSGATSGDAPRTCGGSAHEGYVTRYPAPAIMGRSARCSPPVIGSRPYTAEPR